MPGGVTHTPAAALLWEGLRAQARLPGAGLTGPGPPGHGQCATCRGPAGGGFARCFQCALHAEIAPGALADVVVPIAFAPKGSRYAQALWQYKSDRAWCSRAVCSARQALRALLLVFLHDHGPCVWRSAAMPVPTHVSVVPSSRGRPGGHPLRLLALPCVARPRPAWSRDRARGCLAAVTSTRAGSARPSRCPARRCCCWTTRGRPGRARRARPSRCARPGPGRWRWWYSAATWGRPPPARLPPARLPPALLLARAAGACRWPARRHARGGSGPGRHQGRALPPGSLRRALAPGWTGRQ